MNEKEMNLAILNKLYEIAHKVFVEGVNVPDGNYTANDLAKKGESIFKECYLQTETKKAPEYNKAKNVYEIVEKECYVAPMANVSVLSFVCSFCLVRIFHLVAKFEQLAQIGSKRQIFVAANNVGNIIRTFEVEINKDLGKLAKFAATNKFGRAMRPIMANVCLDISRHRAVASDGHTLQVRQFAVCPGSAWNESDGAFFPLVDADEWKKMCAAAGKGAKLVCKLVEKKISDTETKMFWYCECCGVTSKVDYCRYPNYLSVIPKVDVNKCLQLDKKTWNAAKKWIKTNIASIDKVIIKHEENSANVKFIINDIDFGIENVAEFPCVGTPSEYYYVCVKASTLAKVVDEFNLYLSESADRALTYISDKVITLQMPLLADEEGYFLGHTNKTDAFDVANFPTKEQISLLDSAANCCTESVEYTKVVSNTTEQANEPVSAKNEPAKEQTKVASENTLVGKTYFFETNEFALKYTIKEFSHITGNYLCECYNYKRDSKEIVELSKTQIDDMVRLYSTTENEMITRRFAKNKPIKVERKVTLDSDTKKFTFDKVGVQVGDVLTFVDGTEVIAAEDNKVQFCGELFTLTKFCKEFMPDERRSKSNSYRGCDYFYKDGVKLSKLLKEYQKNVAATLESKDEEVASEKEETTAKVVNVASESIETTEQTITYPAKEIALDAKESTSKANVIMLDVGTLGKVVQISLGVPPECAEAISGRLPIIEPPNVNVRLVDVGCKLNNAAVGDYSLVGGKVVHTLPLPPPQGKRISYHGKLLYHLLIRKQKWKRIFVHLASLPSVMASATD